MNRTAARRLHWISGFIAIGMYFFGGDAAPWIVAWAIFGHAVVER